MLCPEVVFNPGFQLYMILVTQDKLHSPQSPVDFSSPNTLYCQVVYIYVNSNQGLFSKTTELRPLIDEVSVVFKFWSTNHNYRIIDIYFWLTSKRSRFQDGDPKVGCHCIAYQFYIIYNKSMC